MGTIAAKYLKLYLVRREELVKAQRPTNALFLSCRGHRYNAQTLMLILRSYAKKAGITKRVTPHSFRHAVATHLLDNGANVSIIQRLLGHESLETTTRYFHVSIKRLKITHSRFHPREREKLKDHDVEIIVAQRPVSEGGHHDAGKEGGTSTA
jgi:integrase/recombinase XerD